MLPVHHSTAQSTPNPAGTPAALPVAVDAMAQAARYGNYSADAMARVIAGTQRLVFGAAMARPTPPTAAPSG
ncbi:hypothetical protein ACFL5O_10365 [Myxococcota bacterium]